MEVKVTTDGRALVEDPSVSVTELVTTIRVGDCNEVEASGVEVEDGNTVDGAAKDVEVNAVLEEKAKVGEDCPLGEDEVLDTPAESF